MSCLCGRDNPPRAGEPISLGAVLGNGQEPFIRWARIVGIRHGDVRRMERVIVREFREGDGRWPTGEYRTTWLLVPWDHDHPTERLGVYR